MEGYSKSFLPDNLFRFNRKSISGLSENDLQMTNMKAKSLNLSYIIVFVLMMFLGISNVTAQSNDDCLGCHNDPTLTSEKQGKKISRYIPANALDHSVHKNVTCASCHKDAAVADFPILNR